MDYESERTRSLGCWDGEHLVGQSVQEWSTSQETPDFELGDDFCNFLIDVGFGKDCPSSVRQFWTMTMKANYQGDAGRRRARMAAINLKERDGLHSRLFDIRCPVMWLHVSVLVYLV